MIQIVFHISRYLICWYTLKPITEAYDNDRCVQWTYASILTSANFLRIKEMYVRKGMHYKSFNTEIHESGGIYLMDHGFDNK